MGPPYRWAGGSALEREVIGKQIAYGVPTTNPWMSRCSTLKLLFLVFFFFRGIAVLVEEYSRQMISYGAASDPLYRGTDRNFKVRRGPSERLAWLKMRRCLTSTRFSDHHLETPLLRINPRGPFYGSVAPHLSTCLPNRSWQAHTMSSLHSKTT